MSLPDVPIPPDAIINEYYERTSILTAENIRLTVMVHQLDRQLHDLRSSLIQK